MLKNESKELLPAAPDDLMDYTYQSLIGGWLDNFALNLPRIRSGQGVDKLPKWSKQPALIIAGGPSIDKYNQLKTIADAKWKHPIFVCDKMLIPVLKAGILPNYVATVDGHPIISKFYKDRVVTENARKIQGVFNVVTHPSTLKEWRTRHGHTNWFVSIIDRSVSPAAEIRIDKHSVTYALCAMSNYKPLMSGMGNVGAFLWNLAVGLECEPLILIGFDFAEYVRDKSEALYFWAFTQMFLEKGLSEEEAQDKAALLHQVEKNPDFNNSYLINPVWKRYREIMAVHIVQSKVETINCTGGGSLHTDAVKAPNFKTINLEEALAKYA